MVAPGCCGGGVGRGEEQVLRVGVDSMPLQQRRPAHTLMDAIHPRWPPERSEEWEMVAFGQKLFDAELAFGTAAVKVDGDVHRPGLQRQRPVQPMGWQQLESAHQGHGIFEPALRRIQEPVLWVRPAGGHAGPARPPGDRRD